MMPTNRDNTADNTPGDGTGATRPMTTAEMLELAVIDALGLLDDDDRAAFDRAFGSSPATLRELIRAEQARIVDTIDFLPDIEAPERLREKTLARIREEMRPAPARAAAADRAPLAHAAPAARPPRLARARRVNPVWRVAAVALSVALVVVGALHVQLRQQFDSVREQGRMASFIDAVGIERIEAALFSPSAERFQFAAVGDVGRARAVLMYDAQTDSSRLYVMNLPTRQTFEVVVLDENDAVVESVSRFTPNGLLAGCDVSVQRAGPVRLAIRTTGDSPVLLFIADVRLA